MNESINQIRRYDNEGYVPGYDRGAMRGAQCGLSHATHRLTAPPLPFSCPCHHKGCGGSRVSRDIDRGVGGRSDGVDTAVGASVDVVVSVGGGVVSRLSVRSVGPPLARGNLVGGEERRTIGE